MQSNKSVQWHPSAQIETLHLRAELLKKIRLFFDVRNILEVETPCLSCAATTDPYIDSLVTDYQPNSLSKQTRYLHTSPEMPMKRLLAADIGSIYQICKVFRQGERGRLHNPEFTMLEWYRPGMSYRNLMEEVALLITQVLPEKLKLTTSEYLTYREIFEKYANVDPFEKKTKALIECANNAGIHSVQGLLTDDHDGWLSLILTHCIEPHLGKNKLTFVYDFPVSQASLARTRQGISPVAERFELYINGMELANGFQELTDSVAQRNRFERDLQVRQKKALAPVPYDENMLAALKHGLPDCSGVALGIDRLCMILADVKSIEEVITFSFPQA